jgi:hypothetical protein
MSVFSAFRSALPDRDPDGQAPSPRYRGAAVADRDIDELIGIVKGVMADGHVVDDEARFLLDWMQTHANVSNVWPVNVLYPRILAAMKDEHVDPAEEMALLGMLRQAIGKNGPMQGEATCRRRYRCATQRPRSTSRIAPSASLGRSTVARATGASNR